MRNALTEGFDSYVNWLVLAIFLMSVNLLLEASSYLVAHAAGQGLQAWAQWPARACNVAIAVALIAWIRLPAEDRRRSSRRQIHDEYVTETVKRSAFIAFFLTLCLVAILDVVTNHTRLPADFFIKLPGLSLTASFSVSFFFLNYHAAPTSSEDDSSR